jgi:hypothetical protein
MAVWQRDDARQRQLHEPPRWISWRYGGGEIGTIRKVRTFIHVTEVYSLASSLPA